VIYEPTARLVYSNLGLAELFSSTANRLGMVTDLLHPEDVAGKIAEHLQSLGTAATMVTDASVLRQIDLKNRLNAMGVELCDAAETLQPSMLITDCMAAVAETGSLVFHRTPDFTLPPDSVVILEPKNFVPDLIDLFERSRKTPKDMVLISGPNRLRLFVLH
jgi:L-lactate utilization protein LutC